MRIHGSIHLLNEAILESHWYLKKHFGKIQFELHEMIFDMITQLLFFHFVDHQKTKQYSLAQQST